MRRFAPVLWASLILVVSQVLTYFIAFQQKAVVEYYEIAPPEVSSGLPLVYFFGAVVVLGACPSNRSFEPGRSE